MEYTIMKLKRTYHIPFQMSTKHFIYFFSPSSSIILLNYESIHKAFKCFLRCRSVASGDFLPERYNGVTLHSLNRTESFQIKRHLMCQYVHVIFFFTRHIFTLSLWRETDQVLWEVFYAGLIKTSQGEILKHGR